MARKFLYLVAFCIVVFIAGRIALQFYPEQLSRITFTPGARFKPQPALAANAYAASKLWIARPDMAESNPAQWLPDRMADRIADRGKPIAAAVFFIHPTTYYEKLHWNGPTDDAVSGQLDTVVARTMASAFNQAAVWVPRYRQATVGAFFTDRADGKAALDLAYRDVLEAFDAFLAATPADQPIVLAGHSQGSFHLKRLLSDRIAGTPLARRVIAAYVIGWPVELSAELPALGLPACTAPDQAGCIVSYMSFTDVGDPAVMRAAYRHVTPGANRPDARFLCSNPLTGGIGGSAPPSANLGATVPDLKMEHAALKPGLVGATCAPDDTLRIGEGPDMGPFVLPIGNYHIYDYALYWSNLRADFNRRDAAWGKPAPPGVAR